MPPLSKRIKQIKKLTEDKRKKNQISESSENSNLDDYDNSEWESDEEIIWGDDELDEKAEIFFKILSNGMKNYAQPAQRSVYIGNSVQTKKRKKAQAK